MNDHYLKSGLWTLTKSGPVEKLKRPYGLFFNGQLIDHFKTSEAAKQEAEYQEVTQI